MKRNAAPKQKVVKKRNYKYELFGVGVVLVLFAVCFLVTRDPGKAAAAFLLTYYPITMLLRNILQGDHRQGIKRLQENKLEEALVCFEKSEAFFTKHEWVDKYRFLTMLNSSAYSFREMSLQNQAYALIRLERKDEAAQRLEKLLAIAPWREDAAKALEELRAEARQDETAGEAQ